MERAGGSLEGETEQEKREGEQQELLEGGWRQQDEGGVEAAEPSPLTRQHCCPLHRRHCWPPEATGRPECGPAVGSSAAPGGLPLQVLVPLSLSSMALQTTEAAAARGEQGRGAEEVRQGGGGRMSRRKEEGEEQEQEEGEGGAGRGGAIWLDFFPLENWRGTGKGGKDASFSCPFTRLASDVSSRTSQSFRCLLVTLQV